MANHNQIKIGKTRKTNNEKKKERDEDLRFVALFGQ
jgi:hypothetical protein